MLLAAFAFQAAVHNGCIYVLGGINGSTTVERYDPKSNSWNKMCSLNIGRGNMGCAFVGDQLWAVGGEMNPNFRNNVSVYDAECNKWVEKKPIPEAARYRCYVVPKALLQNE